MTYRFSRFSFFGDSISNSCIYQEGYNELFQKIIPQRFRQYYITLISITCVCIFFLKQKFTPEKNYFLKKCSWSNSSSKNPTVMSVLSYVWLFWRHRFSNGFQKKKLVFDYPDVLIYLYMVLDKLYDKLWQLDEF